MTQKSKQKKQASTSVDKNDEILRIRQEMLAKEVDEELQKERLLNIWNKYKFLISFIVISLIAGTIGYEWYKNYQANLTLSESDRFETAVIRAETAQNNADKQQALDLFHALGTSAKTGYRYLALLSEADLLVDQGKTQPALDILKNMMSDKNASALFQDTARLQYVVYQEPTPENATELLNILAPLMVPANPYYPAAAELSAALYLTAGAPDKAAGTLQQALATLPNLPEQAKQRFTDYITLIEKQ